MPRIVIGRDESDLEQYGEERGTAFLGKHIVGEKREAHTANVVQMDVARPHVVSVFGKRGSGKSYTLGVIAEELMDVEKSIKQNLSTLIVDTMGIYWSMKNPNERDAVLLDRWDLEPEELDIKVYIPKGQKEHFDERAVPYDRTFTLKPSELNPGDWLMAFDLEQNSPEGILLGRIIRDLKDKEEDFSLGDIRQSIRNASGFQKKTKESLINRFDTAEDWGVFSEKGTPVKELIGRGQVSVLDVSLYGELSSGWSVRTLIVALLAKKFLRKRMEARRVEEIEEMEGTSRSEVPIVWMLLDEAHQFAPAEGEVPSLHPLLQWVKIGREPGVSLAAATQRPNKLHPDVIAQSDLVLSHRLTAKADIDALRNVMQTYMRYDLADYIDNLPRKPGAAIILDDNSERIYSMRVRPRKSWHAGGTPIAIKE